MIHNLTIKTVRTVTCDFSADQWGLFTQSFPRDEIERIASNLNIAINVSVNCGYDLAYTYEYTMNKMAEYKNYGAYDSEPMHFLERVLDEIYGAKCP